MNDENCYYPKEIKQIAEVLLKEIEKHYPGLTKHNFDSCGFIQPGGSPAQNRAEMCLYIELMKAGAFKTVFEIIK